MKISSDSSCGMGYIYLRNGSNESKGSNEEISKHVSSDKLNIPYMTDGDFGPLLEQMGMAKHTFKADYEVAYRTEYGSDMDEQGYLIGIELTLSHEQLIELVIHSAFKVIQTDWNNKGSHIITFDHMDNVFNSNNVIYKLTDQQDAYVIVHLVEPEELGIQYADNNKKLPVALIKGLISARDDIYDLDYMLKPEFVLL